MPTRLAWNVACVSGLCIAFQSNTLIAPSKSGCTEFHPPTLHYPNYRATQQDSTMEQMGPAHLRCTFRYILDCCSSCCAARMQVSRQGQAYTYSRSLAAIVSGYMLINLAIIVTCAAPARNKLTGTTSSRQRAENAVPVPILTASSVAR